MKIPETLKQRIDVYKENARLYRHDNELFSEVSWFAVMNGQSLFPNHYHPNVNIMPIDELEKRMSDIRRVWAKCLDQMPSHQSYIDQHCKMA